MGGNCYPHYATCLKHGIVTILCAMFLNRPLSVLAYKHTKLRLAQGQLLGSAEYQFSSRTELLLQYW